MSYLKTLWSNWRRWRKVRKAMKQIYLRNLCPVCNSDAPEIDDCCICFGDRDFPKPPKTALTMATIYLTAVALEATVEGVENE